MRQPDSPCAVLCNATDATAPQDQQASASRHGRAHLSPAGVGRYPLRATHHESRHRTSCKLGSAIASAAGDSVEISS